MRPLRCPGRRQTHSSQKPLRETSRRNGLAPLRRESQNNQSNWSNQANSTFSLSECQCSICHDWFRGRTGPRGPFFPETPFTSQSDVRTSGRRVPGKGRVRGGHFSRELLLHRKAMSVQVGGGFRGKDGSEGTIFSRELLLHRKAISVQVGGGLRGKEGVFFRRRGGHGAA